MKEKHTDAAYAGLFSGRMHADVQGCFVKFVDALFGQDCDAECVLKCYEFREWAFPQLWGSTALGIDQMPDGKATIGGDAMTEAETVVIYCKEVDIAGVFFGNTPAYVVTNPTSEFWNDIKEQRLLPVSKAKETY